MATFNTRIQNRIDTWENWITVNPTPLKGEICIATVPADTGVSQNEPCILIKIGDGEKDFKNLPILSARAADVYEWARAATKPGYEAGEIGGIDTYIANYVNNTMGLSVDTDTQYQIVKVDDYNYKLQSKGKKATEWADVAGSAFVIPKYDDTALAGRVGDVESELAALKGSAEGSISDLIAAAIADLATKGEVQAVQKALDDYKTENDAAVEAAQKAGDDAQDAADALAEKIGTVTEGKTVVEMISEGDEATLGAAKTYAEQQASAAQSAAEKTASDALSAYKTENDAAVAAKVASVTAGDASVTIGGTATAPTVAAKLSSDADNALTLAEDGLKVVIPAAAEYSIVKAENSGDYAAVYNLTKDGAIVGASINIPKDMVVESGSVVENPEGQPEGTYIKLVLQNVSEPLYVNVGSLIEYVTSGSQAGDMVVISVSDDHKVTATITDGTITLAKLTTDVQTAIGKAHSHENADVLAGINADKVAAWDAAEQNAKDHADDLNEAMDERVQALEGKDHEHANKDLLDTYTQTEADLADAVAKKHAHANADELALIESGDKAKWDAAAADTATIKGDYLKGSDKTELEGKITAAQQAAEKTASDALSGAKTELEGKITAAQQAAEKAVSDLDAELKPVAKSGNIKDLTQTEGEFIILNCGSAAKWAGEA